MSDWFTTARDTLTGATATLEPQDFERPCVCGEVLRGQRTPLAQEVTCNNCARTWLILPRDPYPRPKPRSNKPPLLKRLQSLGGSVRGRNSQGATTGRGTSTSGSGSPTANDAQSQRKPLPPLKTQLAAKFRDTKTRVKERLIKAARPIRLVGFGMLFALLLTGLWMWHRAQIDAASATLVKVVPLAEQALEEHDFVTAEQLMGEAASAVTTLGATDLTAQNVRQRHRELVAITQLAVQTPYDLVAEAEGFTTNPDEWSQRFAATYSGRWAIFDTSLSSPQAATSIPSSDDGGKISPPQQVVVLELPLFAGEHPVRFEMPAETFKRLKTPTRAIFAAQYDSWQLVERENELPTWIVKFRPATAFLWSSPDIYEAIGLQPDDATRTLLDRQAKALGMTASPSQTNQPSDKAAPKS